MNPARRIINHSPNLWGPKGPHPQLTVPPTRGSPRGRPAIPPEAPRPRRGPTPRLTGPCEHPGPPVAGSTHMGPTATPVAGLPTALPGAAELPIRLRLAAVPCRRPRPMQPVVTVPARAPARCPASRSALARCHRQPVRWTAAPASPHPFRAAARPRRRQGHRSHGSGRNHRAPRGSGVAAGPYRSTAAHGGAARPRHSANHRHHGSGAAPRAGARSAPPQDRRRCATHQGRGPRPASWSPRRQAVSRARRPGLPGWTGGGRRRRGRRRW
jgi:hypothetical protein